MVTRKFVKFWTARVPPPLSPFSSGVLCMVYMETGAQSVRCSGSIKIYENLLLTLLPTISRGGVGGLDGNTSSLA